MAYFLLISFTVIETGISGSETLISFIVIETGMNGSGTYPRFLGDLCFKFGVPYRSSILASFEIILSVVISYKIKTYSQATYLN